MNFLTDRIRPIYFKYLSTAFGSALNLVHLRRGGCRHGGAVSGADGHGGAGRGGPGLEHHLQSGPADRHRRQCAAEYHAGPGGRQRKAVQRILFGGCHRDGHFHPADVGVSAQRRRPGAGHQGDAVRRYIQRIWRLFLRVYAGHGHHGRGHCHGHGFRVLPDHHAAAFRPECCRVSTSRSRGMGMPSFRSVS